MVRIMIFTHISARDRGSEHSASVRRPSKSLPILPRPIAKTRRLPDSLVGWILDANVVPYMR